MWYALTCLYESSVHRLPRWSEVLDRAQVPKLFAGEEKEYSGGTGSPGVILNLITAPFNNLDFSAEQFVVVL